MQPDLDLYPLLSSSLIRLYSRALSCTNGLYCHRSCWPIGFISSHDYASLSSYKRPPLHFASNPLLLDTGQ